jgi:flavin reductase (DIM6/NTAB) family NADH-FMN oxidoreductase RutF
MDERWLQALGSMTYGIYVLTTHHEGTINGMVASWVTQISYDPPLVMVAVHPNRYSHQLIQQSGTFALHLLSKDQKDFLSRFKCLGYLECSVRESYAPGNHSLFIGEIVEAKLFSHDDPLSTLDYEGMYLGKV